jgi:RNA polymerase sigma factor (sigma-70 family)
MKIPTDRQWRMVIKIDRMLWNWAYQSTPFRFQSNRDCVQESYDILQMKAVLASTSFKPSKGCKFSTYIGKHIRKHVYRHWQKKIRKTESPYSLSYLMDEDRELFESIGYVDNRQIEFDELAKLNEAISTLSERQRYVVTRWAGMNGEKLPIADIAKRLRVSTEMARLIKKQAFAKIKFYLTKGIE